MVTTLLAGCWVTVDETVELRALAPENAAGVYGSAPVGVVVQHPGIPGEEPEGTLVYVDEGGAWIHDAWDLASSYHGAQVESPGYGRAYAEGDWDCAYGVGDTDGDGVGELLIGVNADNPDAASLGVTYTATATGPLDVISGTTGIEYRTGVETTHGWAWCAAAVDPAFAPGGRPAILVQAGEAFVLLEDGLDGTAEPFGKAYKNSDYPVHPLLPGDLDGDGFDDAIVDANAGDEFFLSAPGQAAGDSDAVFEKFSFPDYWPRYRTVGDATGDGQDDLLVLHQTDDLTEDSILLRLYAGPTPLDYPVATVRRGQGEPLGETSGAEPVYDAEAVGDIDADGRADFSIRADVSTRSFLFLGGAEGAADLSGAYIVLADTTGHPYPIGDLDGDIAVDLLVAGRRVHSDKTSWEGVDEQPLLFLSDLWTGE